MSCEPLYIRKGEAFEMVIRYDMEPVLYKAISGISLAGAPVLTVPSHGIPNGWTVRRITSTVGTTQINTHRLINGVWEPTALGERYPNGLKATYVDANSIRLNELNGSGFTPYVSGGYVEYMTPVDLDGYTAKMDIRDPDDLTTLHLTLSTANARITLNNTDKTISLYIAVADVNAITWTEGVTTLELTPADGKTKLVFPNRKVIVQETDITQ